MADEELVGPAPKGWEYTTLGAACQQGGGDIQTGPFGSQLHASDYVPVGIPSIMPQNIGDNCIIEDGIARITSEDAKRLSRYLVRVGDIVYSRRGDVERRALVRNHEDGWLCGTGCLRVRLGARGPDQRFTTYYLGHPSVREWIVRHAHGATMPNLNTSILSACPLLVPPPSEQRAIAHILGALDDKIDLIRRMNETLKMVTRANFWSWFVRFDPVRAKAEGRDPCLPLSISSLFPTQLVESELGDIPLGWRIAKVADICSSIFSGGTPSTRNSEYWDGDVPWLSSGETRSKFILDTERKITSEGVRNSSTRLAPSLSTVIASAGQGNTRGQTSLLTFESYVNQSVVVLVHDPRTSSPLHLFFDLERRYEEFRRLSDGHSSRGSLTTKLLASIPVVLPPIELIREFERLVAPLVARAVAGLRESRNLLTLRDTLLPKLVSGEIRVKNAERVVSRAV